MHTVGAGRGVHGAKPGSPHPRITLLWQRLVLFVMTSAAKRLQAMPRPAVLRFGTRLGTLAGFVARGKKQRAMANLHLAYGDGMTGEARRAKHAGRSTPGDDA